MAWTHAIMQLQEADTELRNNQKRLAELLRLLADASAVQSAEQRFEQARESAKQARIAQETREFELGKVQNKLRADTERLYSGRITNARELQDLQAETESLKRHITTLEDQLLELMLVREEADEQAGEAEETFQRISAETADNHQQLTQEQHALEARNTALASRQIELKQQIPASILDTYEYLKSRTGNVPVATLNGEICSVCGIEVIKPVQQKARRNLEAICGGCNRLLVILD